MSEPVASSVIVVALTHDLVRHRSIVSLRWTDDPEKNITLPVPFGCSLDTIQTQAETALLKFSAEIATVVLAQVS